mmetsp:Transcript_111878/g.311395  ORF Transcript_111878/g.311395 Transcript_111878/m.311395 type:complete len:228 (-) Transcript_111878:2789-3472(-)
MVHQGRSSSARRARPKVSSERLSSTRLRALWCTLQPHHALLAHPLHGLFPAAVRRRRGFPAVSASADPSPAQQVAAPGEAWRRGQLHPRGAEAPRAVALHTTGCGRPVGSARSCHGLVEGLVAARARQAAHVIGGAVAGSGRGREVGLPHLAVGGAELGRQLLLRLQLLLQSLCDEVNLLVVNAQLFLELGTLRLQLRHVRPAFVHAALCVLLVSLVVQDLALPVPL